MPYIIDGNNLIGVEGAEALKNEDSRQVLVNLLKAFQKQKRTSLIVVFDGSGENFIRTVDRDGKFRIQFPEIDQNADECIKSILNRFSSMKDVILITSDRELKDFARSKGAKVINSIEFYHLLKQKAYFSQKNEEERKRVNLSLSEQEVETWLKIFQKK